MPQTPATLGAAQLILVVIVLYDADLPEFSLFRSIAIKATLPAEPAVVSPAGVPGTAIDY